MKTTLFYSFLILAVCGCEDHDRRQYDYAGERYFPLQVGNYWNLVPGNPMGMYAEITVTDEVVIHGKHYFKVHRKFDFTPPDPDYENDAYIRIDEKDYLYVLTDSTANLEAEILRLGAPDGYKWENPYIPVSVRIENLEINGHALPDCKRFSFDDPDYWDEEHAETYAPGIGYAELDAGWGRFAVLSTAIIDGEEYNFE